MRSGRNPVGINQGSATNVAAARIAERRHVASRIGRRHLQYEHDIIRMTFGLTTGAL